MKGKSYMRAQNRGNSVFAKMMTIVALMLTFIVTGAWAQQTYTVTFSADYSQTISDATLPYNKTISCTDLNPWAESFSSVNVEKGDGKVSASIDGGSMTITVSGAFSGEADVWCPIIDDGGDQILYVVKVTCVANAPAEPVATYAVSLAEDTEDATSWQGKAGEGKYQSLPLTGLEAGTTVTLKYSGNREVKSVKVKKVKPAATVTTAPTAKTGVKAGQNEAIVNAGTATGGTMMYQVTTANTKPTSTEGFSDAVPTAKTLAAGTFYVWYYVKADDSHTDSEISATGIEVTIAAAYPMAAEATSADKGKLICADGHIHANGADAACTKARVAKIIYIGTTGHATYSHGLALALTDEASTMAWQDAIDACSAKNTNTPVTGATWLLASYYQWGYMLGTNGAGSYTALLEGFSSVGGTDLQSEVGYWSSTASSDRQAYYFNFNKSDYFTGLKTYAKWVRACLAF